MSNPGTSTWATSTATKKGIVWSGSLLGSHNPSNLGYQEPRYQKRYKLTEEQLLHKKLPSSLIIQFRNKDGEEVGENMDVPTTSNCEELCTLLHSLLDEEDQSTSNKKQPYAFYATLENGEEVEITSSITSLLTNYQSLLSTEKVLEIKYQPLALFRVRPVTRCTDTLQGHTEAILHVSFSPDGKQLASGGGDTTVRFWDIQTNTCKTIGKGHKNHVLCVSWSPDSRRFASGDKSGMLISWDIKHGKALPNILRNAHKKFITSICWEPLHLNSKCERIVSSSKDGTIRVWNVRTQSCEITLSGHLDSVECVVWSGEGLLYSASRDRTIKVWAANLPLNQGFGKLIRTLQGHAHRVNTLALSCEYVTRTGPFDPMTYTFYTNEEGAYQHACQKYKDFKGNSESERLISGSDDNTLIFWDPTVSKHPIKRLTGHQQLVNHIAFSPDARYFASASFDKKVKLWDGKTGQYLATFTGHVGAVYRVAWSSDSRYLCSASKDSTVKLWQLGEKNAVETLPGHADEVYALDWSPSGRGGVASGSKDRTIKIWKH